MEKYTTVSIPKKLAEVIDELLEIEGFRSRSEFVITATRKSISNYNKGKGRDNASK